MIQIFDRHPFLAGGMILCVLTGFLCQLAAGNFYMGLLREAENMAATDDPVLKQCKLKFVNCYKLNDGVANVSIFVDRFLGKIKVRGFRVGTLISLSTQLTLLGVLVAGLGAARGIVLGETIGEILPFYVYSFLGLYLHFALQAMTSPQERRQDLKIALMDYLENHMLGRIAETEYALNQKIDKPVSKPQEVKLQGVKLQEVKFVQQEASQKEHTSRAFSKTEEQELEVLLKEFLA